MQEIQEKYNLKIYIDNVFCDPTEDVSCPRSIIISYKSQVITLKNHNLMGAPQLEVQYEWFGLRYTINFNFKYFIVRRNEVVYVFHMFSFHIDYIVIFPSGT